MTPVRSGSRVAHLFVALVLAMTAAFAAAAPVADAATVHRAGVIVDTGSEVHRVVITFSQDSITGLQALQLAGADPVVGAYSGQGAAICSLYGVGHAATQAECLGTSSDPRYWAYWHVPAGQSGFTDATYSRGGAGVVQVHDGDVDGWKFGTGTPPVFATINQISPPPPVTTPPPATAAPARTPAVGTVVPAGGVSGGPTGVPTGGGTTITTTLAPVAPLPGSPAAVAAAAAAAANPDGSSTTSSTRGKSPSEVEAERASATHNGSGSSSPVLSIAGFLAVLAVLGGGIFFARRARVGRSAGGS